jgi:hypothetical protein
MDRHDSSPEGVDGFQLALDALEAVRQGTRAHGGAAVTPVQGVLADVVSFAVYKAARMRDHFEPPGAIGRPRHRDVPAGRLEATLIELREPRLARAASKGAATVGPGHRGKRDTTRFSTTLKDMPEGGVLVTALPSGLADGDASEEDGIAWSVSLSGRHGQQERE